MSNYKLLRVLLFFIFCPAVVYGATGILEIYSEPSGASVYIDNNYVGKTPYQNPMISTGRHGIKVELSKDYPPQHWDVTIDAITPQTKTFYFKKGDGGKFTGKEMEQTAEKYKGNVQFASMPSGAMVFIDGKQMKKTPLGYSDLDVGNYSVEFRLDGKSLKGKFSILSNDTVKLIADFNNKKIINSCMKENLNNTCWLFVRPDNKYGQYLYVKHSEEVRWGVYLLSAPETFYSGQFDINLRMSVKCDGSFVSTFPLTGGMIGQFTDSNVDFKIFDKFTSNVNYGPSGLNMCNYVENGNLYSGTNVNMSPSNLQNDTSFQPIITETRHYRKVGLSECDRIRQAIKKAPRPAQDNRKF